MFRPCLACGALFATLNPRRRFCSAYCRSAHYHLEDAIPEPLDLGFRRLMAELERGRAFYDSS